MKCRIEGVRPDLDVAVPKILDDEVNDNNDDKDNNEEGVRVGRRIQGMPPFSPPSPDIVGSVLKPIGGTASHHHRQSLRARSDLNNRGSIGPQSRGLIRRRRRRRRRLHLEESMWPCRSRQRRHDKGMHTDRRRHKFQEFRRGPIATISGLTCTNRGPKRPIFRLAYFGLLTSTTMSV